jgi:hypothetical protein
MKAALEKTTSGWMQTGATQNKRFGAMLAAAVVGCSVAIVEYRPLVGRGAKLFGAVAGGLIGFCIGPVTLDFLVGVFWRQPEGPWSNEVGAWLGAGIGLFGCAFLGASIVGGSLVARWCRRTACAVGAVTFLVGFVGPLIFWPDNNLGPLIGIFLTGPLGFVGGAVIGLCIGLEKERVPTPGLDA